MGIHETFQLHERKVVIEEERRSRTMNNENGMHVDDEKMNLWTSIWIKPREAVRYAIDNKSMKFAIILVLIAGVFDVLNGASQNNLGDRMPVSIILMMTVILGPFLGLIGWWIAS